MSSWKALLLRIGEKCPEYGGIDDFKDHIESCYGAVRRELEHSGDDILLYLIQCAEQLPHKIPLYGTLVGLLNLEDEQFVSKVVEKTHSGLQAALISEDCNKIRILMRFLTVLMCCKVLQPSSIFGVFETLLASAATTLEARGDFYVRCIMSCLPWGGPELIEQVPEDVDRIMAGLEAYFSIRKHVSDTGLSVFEDLDETDNAVEEKDFLEDLWSRIQELSNAGWKLESVPRPHLSFEAQLVAGKSHDFGSINCPEQSNPSSVHSGISYGRQRHEAEFKYPQRIRRLNIFPASKVEDIQPIDRFVVEEYLLDVLLYLNGCRKECAAYMAGLPVPFRYEYLMAETIFSQLLLLPEPPFKPTYYTLVIIDLCKALPGAFPAVVAGAVRVLFEKIAELDMECRTRLILWFSHHLSNFQFIWPWEEWAHVLDLPKWAPQRVFVQEVLEREIRLSYYDKIKQSIEVAPALEQLLPPKGGPDFKYSGDDSGNETERELSLELSKMMRGRQTSREIIAWIEDSLLPAHSLEIVLSVVIQTILDSGSKSFTHLITILERYGQVISKICHDQERQIMLIGEVSSFWKNNSQMIALTIDRMMGYRLLSNLAIIRWVFSASNVSQFHICDHPWEILRNAVTKTYNRMSDLRKEITSVKKSVLLAEEAASKAQGELQAAESKLTLKDGEPVLGENPVRMKRIKSNANRAAEEALSVRESLEAKEALLARAVEENEALFLTLYKNFSSVLAEPLSLAFKEEVAPPSNQADEMAIDLEVSATMDLDDESSKPKTRKKSGDGYNINERDQWCLSTLGYLKAITRQYASEIWSYIEKIDAEVLTEDVHPLFRQAVYKGLRRPLDEMNMS